jgi:hypothetical protein
MQAHPHFHDPPRQAVPLAAPYVPGKPDRIFADVFNDNIKPGMVKIIFLENRIVPNGLPFVPVETPEGNRRGKQGTEQDKPGFKPPLKTALSF